MVDFFASIYDSGFLFDLFFKHFFLQFKSLHDFVIKPQNICMLKFWPLKLMKNLEFDFQFSVVIQLSVSLQKWMNFILIVGHYELTFNTIAQI